MASWEQGVGISLALLSGAFIGASVVFTKRALLDLKATGHDVSSGSHEYLKSGMWWIGMTLTALGEVANFGAYAFVPAILVTPLGAISVVISAILSAIFLNEKLNFSGIIGCAQCLIGAVIIVLHAPASHVTETIPQFMHLVVQPVFLVYSAFVAAALCYLIIYLQPRYAQKSPVIYISISSLGGSYLVLSTQGFGTALVYSIRHWKDDNQFLQWPIYPLLAFVVFFILFQVHFLNKALSSFSAAVVTPIYYVFFTTATMISTAFLFQGFPVGDAIDGVSILFGFLTIVGGVALLFQYSLKLQQIAKDAGETVARMAGSIREDGASIRNGSVGGGRMGSLGAGGGGMRSGRPSDAGFIERSKLNALSPKGTGVDMDLETSQSEVTNGMDEVEKYTHPSLSRQRYAGNDSNITIDSSNRSNQGVSPVHITIVESPVVVSPASASRIDPIRNSFVIEGDGVDETDEVTSISHAAIPGLKLIKMMPSLLSSSSKKQSLPKGLAQRSASFGAGHSDARSIMSWARRKSESVAVEMPSPEQPAAAQPASLSEWEGEKPISISDSATGSTSTQQGTSTARSGMSNPLSRRFSDVVSSNGRHDSKASHQLPPLAPPSTATPVAAIREDDKDNLDKSSMSSDTQQHAGKNPYEPLQPLSPGWLASNHTGFEVDLAGLAKPDDAVGTSASSGLWKGKEVASSSSSSSSSVSTEKQRIL
ncbi:hypothetical protein HDU81_011168 [Chytriomyces hyalinus]|nr:hypothetical protein HDU81_011168 [Chytriomyces hyalinus]